MSDRQLMQQALEALEAAEHLYHHVGLVVRRGEVEGVIASLRERLAQKYHWREQWNNCLQEAIDATTPPRREWVGLTEEEIRALWESHTMTGAEITRSIEAKLKGKNNG